VASCNGVGGASAQSLCLLNAPTSGGVAVTRTQPTYAAPAGCPERNERLEVRLPGNRETDGGERPPCERSST
jgi:hypothetical protein